MIGIRRMVGGVFAGMVVAVSMLLVVPAGSAASPRSVPVPPPSGERSPAVRQLPPLLPVLGPAEVVSDAAAGPRVTVLGQELTTCATLHGAIRLSGHGDLSAVGAGDASAVLDGADPVGFVHLDEYLALSAGVGAPGDDQVVPRCAADDPGSADPVTMSPVQGAAVAPDASAAAETAVPSAPPVAPGPDRPGSDDVTADTGPAAQDDAGDPAAGDEPSPAAGSAAGESVAESLSAGIDPAPWGLVIGVLGAVAVAMVVPSAVLFALHNRRGPNWVRANVQTVARAAPAVVVRTPATDWPGLPTFGVQLALRADAGTRSVTEVEQ